MLAEEQACYISVSYCEFRSVMRIRPLIGQIGERILDSMGQTDDLD